jgi:uracil phosphoribosyltransferase
VLDGTGPISPAEGKQLRRELRAEVKVLRADLRAMIEQAVDELPYIRLGSLADARSELDDIKASLTKPMRARLGRS